MANVLVQESSLTAIADAIREKNGTQNSYKPREMAGAISAIDGGGSTPTGTINITTNGTHNVASYASANVQVPTGVTPSGSQTFTENGTYDVTNLAQAVVNVPSSGGTTKLTGTVVLENVDTTYLTIPISGYTLKSSETWLVIARMTRTGEYSDGVTTWYDDDALIIPTTLTSYFMAILMATNKTVATGTIKTADDSASKSSVTVRPANCVRVTSSNAGTYTQAGNSFTITRQNEFYIYSSNASYYFCKEGASVEYEYEAYLLD